MADYQTVGSRIGARAAEIDAGLRAHMSKVYATMSTGMLITAAAAWAIAGLATTTDPSAAYTTAEGGIAAFREGQYLTGLGYAIYASPLRWVIMLAPLAVLFLGMGPVMRNSSAAGARVFFYGFATLIGLSLSSIFLVYTAFSITQTFLITAIAFAGLSLWGYTTKKDLSGWGTFLMMGLIGLIVAMIVNLVLGAFFGIASPALMFAISAIGVLIFAGLTAYDTQNIKSEYVAHAHHGDADWLEKSGVFGALSLYLNFLNMFQFLLMFMGQQE
ncbi:Bax inhibitor-1/YccA family protein [Shimia ponticola]|uniref:Bax inhibitor-1/YccA family protein n=1 Tax=Shimia ponticola TaxID=2582893 RepID=UPI0011BFA505|nr:Bax inhibitor-1/YccA family protein [Shimia ponticola]